MRALGVVVTLSLVLAVVKPAWADARDTKARVAAMKQQLGEQLAALRVQDRKRFEATLTADALVTLGDGAPQQRKELVLQTGVTEPDKITLGKVVAEWEGRWGWAAAETVFVTPPPGHEGGRPQKWTRYWLALFVADGAAVKTRVLVVSRTAPDKTLAGYNYIAELPMLAKPAPAVALLAQPADLAAQLSPRASTTVFGTSPSDRAYGAAAAKKKLASWKHLKLELVGAKKPDDAKHYAPLELVIGDARFTFARVRFVRSKPPHVQMSAFAIARRVGGTWEHVAVLYHPYGQPW